MQPCQVCSIGEEKPLFSKAVVQTHDKYPNFVVSNSN